MSSNVVAIVGRPNVGKSTLFNRLSGRRTAIVHDTAGVTRDRNYTDITWSGTLFFLIDTGGYVPKRSSSKDVFEEAIREQVQISIEEADVVLFVIDAQTGITPIDSEIAKILRKGFKGAENKKTILIVNKADNTATEIVSGEYFRLGLGDPVFVSALTGRRSGDLLDLIISHFKSDESDKSDESLIRFAIIGRPNAGKSSLVNAITNTKRNIVTEIPGTTRDSIDTDIKYYGETITLIDTAGLRKKRKIRKTESLEFYSAIRAYRSMERCDVTIIVIDASTISESLKSSSDPELATFKLDKEDSNIINEAASLKKGILIVINKWDLIEKESTTSKLYEKKVKEHLRSFGYLPFIFISALTKQRISKVLDAAMVVYIERTKMVQTSKLNDKILPVIQSSPPYSKTKREVKINYITQLKAPPPVIAFFTNLPREIEENYKRFLESKIRENFGFEGVPLTLVFKKKN